MVHKGMVKGIEIHGEPTEAKICEPCIAGKQTCTEICKVMETCAGKPLGCIFSDLCGPLPTVSHQGYRYFATSIDDYSWKAFVAGLREKSDVFHNFIDFLVQVELQTRCNLKTFRTDGGGEYTSMQFETYLKLKGICHEITMPNTLQHNGVAEHLNCTLMEKVQAMLVDMDLTGTYWFDALKYAVILQNVSPTHALCDLMPEEAWSGNKPDIAHLRIFRCWAHVHIPKERHDKLSPKSFPCTFLGYSYHCSTYRFVDRLSHCFLESCDVIFKENGQLSECTIISSESDTSSLLENPGTEPDGHPKCIIQAPIRDDDAHYEVTSYRPHHAQANITTIDNLGDPRTYVEAMKRADAAKWEMACEQEKQSFESMGVYTIVPCPKGRKVVGSKWVFCIKWGPNSTIQKYKAHLVAHSFTQIEGINYDETFTPVAKLTSLRTILAISAEHDLEVHQMDVKSTYLNGALKEEIYMEAPPSFDIPDSMVLRLIKAVYGTKQGSRVWYEDIRGTLKQMGYEHTKADHTIFTHSRPSFSIIALYVNDITMVLKVLKVIQKDKDDLRHSYEMTDLGELSWILGIHVSCDWHTGTITLSQGKFAAEVLERFEKQTLRPISTPVLANEHLTKLTSLEVDIKDYQSAVGALMYLIIVTHPDLAFGVGMLGRHTANPGEEHMQALNRVFRYLQGTKDHGLIFKKGAKQGLKLEGYANANWASDRNDRKSTSGYVFLFGGGSINWSSKKQATVALSTTEAEYIAGAHAAKEAVWLKHLLSELHQGATGPITIHVNNQYSIALAHNPEFHDCTKHVDIRYHFLCEKVESGEIAL
jgi:reverse transcriptase-like protein